MLATARPGNRRPQEETVRLRPGDLPVSPLPSTATPTEAKTTRMRPLDLATKALPKAISGFDGMTERLRAVDVPVVGKVANTVRQRYRSDWPWPPLPESAPAKRVIRFWKKVTNSP